MSGFDTLCFNLSIIAHPDPSTTMTTRVTELVRAPISPTPGKPGRSKFGHLLLAFVVIGPLLLVVIFIGRLVDSGRSRASDLLRSPGCCSSSPCLKSAKKSAAAATCTLLMIVDYRLWHRSARCAQLGLHVLNHSFAIVDDLDRDDLGLAPSPRPRSDARERARRQRTAWRI